jgi:DNA-directed RNA polymerase specialized sigma24 family protein
VATTTALMHLRSRGRKSREVSCSQLGDQETSWIETMQAPQPGPDALLAHRQELEKIDRLIAELGGKYTKLLRLRWFEGYSERECSEKLSIPLTTVKTRAFRGRRHVLSECGIAA